MFYDFQTKFLFPKKFPLPYWREKRDEHFGRSDTLPPRDTVVNINEFFWPTSKCKQLQKGEF